MLYSLEVNDEDNYEKTIKQTSRYYVIMGETIKYKNLVHNYSRYLYEKFRFENMSNRKSFTKFNVHYNFHTSIRLWLSNIINAFAIFIIIEHIKSPSMIMSALFQINEIRDGINEIKSFRFRYNRLNY